MSGNLGLGSDKNGYWVGGGGAIVSIRKKVGLDGIWVLGSRISVRV